MAEFVVALALLQAMQIISAMVAGKQQAFRVCLIAPT
jgi:hypothetical protein